MRYDSARIHYQKDVSCIWPETHSIFAVDMQKILILPKMSTKNSYFVSRLVVMNETFASLKNGGKNYCVLWHEATNSRGAAEVASTYYKIISTANPSVTKFTFWVDNCSAQNKNWTIFTMFSTIVNEEWGPELINIKYFEPGHSFMKCDAVHGKIGSAWKKKRVYTT